MLEIKVPEVSNLVKDIPVPNPLVDLADKFNHQQCANVDLIFKGKIKKEKEEREYREKSLDKLDQIIENTATLSDLLSVAKDSKDNIEIISLILQLFYDENEESREKHFSNIMKKIGDTCKNANAIITLTQFASMVYTQASPHIKPIVDKAQDIIK